MSKLQISKSLLKTANAVQLMKISEDLLAENLQLKNEKKLLIKSIDDTTKEIVKITNVVKKITGRK